MAIKHVGAVQNQKVVVAYRTLPDDPYHALVIPTASLSQTYHDELFSIVDSSQGQQAGELASLLSVRKFSDGANMLSALHRSGKLKKVSTAEITMQPGPQRESWINLKDLNEIIAEQKGVRVEDLAIKPTNVQQPNNVEVEEIATVKDMSDTVVEEGQVLSDEQLAVQYRKQADTLYKEVQELRKKADELDPPAPAKRKTTAKSS